MDGGANGSGEFKVSDNKSSSNSDVVTSMKLHICTEAFPSKICAMCIRHRGKEPNRLLSGDGDDGGGGGDSGGGFMGPITNSGGTNVAASTICRVGAENFARSTDLQPFDIFPPPYSSNPYKSPGRMGVSVVFPFTSAQWKELERQAMIFKYMISSVPVPPDLLFPLSSNFREPAGDSSATPTHSGRYPKIGDPEPWRCKRTDGKKWRCSREVAPNQKYCECHLHRGRPRSRKPVEGKVNAEGHKKTRLEQGRRRSLPSSSVQSDSSTASQKYLAANETGLLLNAKNDRSIYATCKGTARNLSITTEGGVVPRNGTELPWQPVMEANMGLENEGFPFNGSGAPTFHQDYMEQQQQLLSVLSYPNFPSPKTEVPAAGFIDAWSIDNMNTRNNRIIESSVSLNEGDLSASLTLSMAMAAGNVLDEEMRSIQMGSCKTKDSLRLSWEPFARGGPLAEALPPGSIAVGGSTPASPYNSMSTPATTVSSPSGVLHRTLFSYSDGSVCNSPTLAAPPSSEAAIQWFN